MPIEQPLELGHIIYPLWPLLAAAFVVLLFVIWRKTHSLCYLLCVAVFSVYLVFALDRVLLPLEITGSYADAMKQVPFSANLNLIPFYFNGGRFEDSIEPMLLNVLLTVPFGFGINFLMPVRTRRALWIALVVGLSTEGLQLILSLLVGYAYRIIDVNDMLMNALGVLVGYGLFRLAAGLYLWLSRRLSFPRWGVFDFLYAVADQKNIINGQSPR